MGKLLCSAAVIACLFGGTVAIAAEKWDMPLAYSATNYHSKNATLFAEAVTAATGGELEIVTHPSGSLFKGSEIKRAVQTGQAQIGERLISALGNENPFFEVDALPFLATSFEDAWKLYEASKTTLTRILDQQNLVLLYAVPWAPQGLYTKGPVQSAADMKGVKFRVYNPMTARVAELMGAIPTQIEAAEISQAFATGVAESMISSSSTGYDRRLWEHTKYWYDVQAWLPKNMVVVNKEAWNGLDQRTRGIITGAAAMAELAGWAKAQERSEWYKEQLAANGMTISPPGDKLKADLEMVGATMTSEWLQRAGADGRSVIEKFEAIR